MRLQKFLSAAGVCSRRKGEEYIQAGKITVNGNVATQLGFKVDTNKDRIEFQGNLVTLAQKEVYIALHKPMGYVTSCNQKNQKIVLDLIGVKERVYPVGRLDKDSTGLLLLTNDGSLHQKLSHPSYNHEKEYDVSVELPISDKDLQRMSEGVSILGRKTRSAIVTRRSEKRLQIILKEGRNRQIRRMVEEIGNRVTKLKRVRIANISLGELKVGKWRYLTKNEIKTLRGQ
ncbi:MAG: rRNA pseudouridine synthase [Desulfobacterium sp.]|nr:rRNA pseudouridine synthase [Desulfobacterium sp.]